MNLTFNNLTDYKGYIDHQLDSEKNSDFDMRSIVLLFMIINVCTGFDRKELKRKKRNSCTESRISKCSKCENLDSSSSAFLKTFCDRKM